MRRKSLLLCFLLLIILFTGCATINYDINVNKDGSGIISFSILYDDQILSYVQKDIINAKGLLKEKGFEVQDYTKGNKTGYKASKNIKDYDEWDKELKNTSENVSDDNIKFLIGKQGNQMYIHSLLDFSANKEGGPILESVDFTINIKVPYKIIDHNATKYEDDVLTWDIDFTGRNIIKVILDASDNTLYIILAILIILSVIGTATIFIIIIKNKNKLDTPTDDTEVIEENINEEANEKTNEKANEEANDNIDENQTDEINKNTENKE